MTYSTILKIVKSHRILIIVSLLLATILGGAAVIYPISYVAMLSLSNNEQYFRFAELKIIKNKLPTFSKTLLEHEQDAELRNFLTNTILDPKWIEKNITPNYFFTKTDGKDLLDAGKIVSDPYAISWLNIQAIAKEKELAVRALEWIAKDICLLVFKQNLYNYINQIRVKAESGLLVSSKILPALYQTSYQLEQNIKILTETNNKYPEAQADQSKLQLSLNASETSEELSNLNNLSILTAYLPLRKQLAIMETQLLRTKDKIKLAELDINLNNIKLDTANEELKRFEEVSVFEFIQDEKTSYYFGEKLNYGSILGDNAPDWLKNYVKTTKNNIHDNELINASHFALQMSQPKNIIIERKYSRFILVLGAVVMGLFAPGLVVFISLFFRKVESKNSD